MLGEELNHRLHQDKKLEWMGVGSFFVDENGTIQFQTKTNYVELHKPLHYQHVIREDAVHEMRVGEEQKSTVEMENFFEEQRNLSVKNKWVRGALILIGIVVVALFARYSKGSFSLLDGRYNKAQLKAIQSTYKVI
jgi:6-phosphogluconolactonase/glucosamine-6-phosphate isomerase/deaminase